MKLLVLLGLFATAYTFALLHTTNIVLDQTQNLNATYQYVANHSDQIASGHRN